MVDFIDIQIGSTKIDVYLVQLLNRVRRKAIFLQYDLFTQYISTWIAQKGSLYAEQLNITVVRKCYLWDH
jgi:hypothetical protein